MSLFNFQSLFGTPKEKKTPADEAKEWKKQLAKEMRHIDRDMNDLVKAEKRASVECKKLAKAEQLSSARLLAKEIVNTRKSRERMLVAKAQMNSVSMALQSNISLMKVQGVVAKSTEVMVAMNKLIKLPEVSKTMGEMAREMERAGLVESMIDDTFELMEPDDMEMAADAEVNKVIEELTSEIFAGAKAAPTSQPIGTGAGVATTTTRTAEEEAAEQAEIDADLKAMRSRLGAL
jgi:charged multivesicular body protein 3